jgi:WD40 repeat protein
LRRRLQVDRLFFCGAIDKYISCGRDGSFRLWNAADLKHVKTVNNGSSWITDCLYLPLSRKMVFTTMDRAITYYDINRCAAALRVRV